MGLKPNIVKASDFINPLLSKKSVEQEKFEKFQNSLNELLKVNKTESEEHQKNAVRDFLAHSFGYEINTKGRIDWAIFKNAKVEVLIEAKRLDNLSEMLTKDELNRKAFHEAILYFMQERAEGNVNLKHIIILTAFSWFIFDAKDFDRLFWQNKQIKKIYTNYKNPSILGDNTKDFYENIAKELPNLKANLIDDLEIECAYFNLQEPQKPKDLIAIYKLLSPDALLKEFNPNDANSLNREFYSELLYILGLEEIKQGSKKIIGKATASQAGSFYENIANKLTQYNRPNDFETIIKLIIIWINRILFLKLLESQIVSWNKNKEFKFLNADKINDYDKLEMLFFEILAKRPKTRKHREFDYIPYLNSSLFEIHENETKYLTISTLEDDAKINYYSKTIIKDEKRAKKSGQTSTLSYLFEFLDAYDFGSTSDEIANESKSLINASVLGLIFEKINGYKDGSFYTPSFITMYMARESLQKSIIEKFNTAFIIEASNFNELKKYCELQSYKDDFSQKANKIIDSLTICDPAVGSGHFLVSALNEIIYIKYQLGLFNLRGLKIELINDELLVKLEDEWFEYTKPKDFQSPNHTVQKMLFLEKQRIIENQLFGVDINPNSSQITKLRLWIELLKNSYYDANYELITLPNIDINIKTGNSLISRFDLKDEIKINNIKHEIKNYKERVREYKENLGTKKDVLASIEDLKNKFRLTLKAEYKVTKDRNQKLREYVTDFGHEGLNDGLLLTAIKNKYGHVQNLFGEKADAKKQAKLLEELTKLEKQIDEIEKGKIYEDAFEWRFEFPEVLDEDGNFVGFDIVIGNPPYIPLENFASADKLFFQNKFKNFSRKYETSVMFIEEGLNILKKDAILVYIAPQTWQTGENYSLFRKNILNNFGINNIINLPFNIFDDAYIDTSIYLMSKKRLNEYKIYSYDKKANISHIDNIDFLNVSIDEINKENYKLVLNRDIGLQIQNNKMNDIVPLGDITMSTQGLSGSKFTEDTIGDLYPYLSNGNVFNYVLTIESTYLTDLSKFKNLIKYYGKEEKILIRRIINRQNRLSVGYTDEKLVFKKDINPFIITDINFSTKYILSLLASKYISWLYVNSSIIATKNDFRQTTLTELRMLPIKKISTKEQQPFINLANEILHVKKENPKADTSELENQIDNMVYKLYGLSDEEIKIVEGEK